MRHCKMRTIFAFLVVLQALDINCKTIDEFCESKLNFEDTFHWYWDYYKTPQILKDAVYVFKKDEYWLYTSKSFLIGKPTKLVTDWRAFTANSAIDAPVNASAVWTEFTFKENHRLQHTVIFAQEKSCYKYLLDNREFRELINNCSSYFHPVNVSLDQYSITAGFLLNLDAYLKKPSEKPARYRSFDTDTYALPKMSPFHQVENRTELHYAEHIGPVYRYLNIFFTSKMTAFACYTQLPLSTTGHVKRDCFEYQNVRPQVPSTNETYTKITNFFRNFVESAMNALGEVIATHEMSTTLYVFNETHFCTFQVKLLIEATTILYCKPQSNEIFFNCTREVHSIIAQNDRLTISTIIAVAAGIIVAFGDYFYDKGFEAGLRGPEYDDELGFK